MKLVISSCMLAFILGCNLTSAIVHVVVKEKDQVSLKCPRSVEGKLTWSRERDGNKVDILTTGGDKDLKHIHDPDKQYSSLADKSLHMVRVKISESGRYFCNNEAAVDLTVLPSGTQIHHATEKAEVTLLCPPDVGGSEDPKWSTDAGEIQQGGRIQVSTVDNTLTIREVQPADSGLYYCGGKPAGYLNVIKGDPSERGEKAETTTTTLPAQPTTTTPPPPPPTTTTTLPAPTTKTTVATPTTTTTVPLTTSAHSDTTTTKKQNKKPRREKDKKKEKKTTPTTPTTTSTQPTHTESPREPPQIWMMVLKTAVPSLLFLLVIIIIMVVYFRRRRFKKQDEEVGPVYEEIQDGFVCLTVNDGSNQNDHTYHTISHLPLKEKRTDTSLQNECPYSLIEAVSAGGNHQDPIK